MDPQPIFDFDLNQAPPSDDGGLTVGAQTAREPSPSPLDDDGGTDDASTAPRQDPLTTRKPSPPPPDVDGTAYALTGRAPSPPPDGMGDGSTWTPEMLDLDVSLSLTDDDEDEEVEGEIESQPPPLSYDFDAPRSPAPTHSPEKMARSCSPEYHAEVAVTPPTAQAYSQSSIDMGAARPSSCMDVDGSAPLSRRYDGRLSRPNSETKPTCRPFPAWSSSSGSSPSRAHGKGTSDTSSSHLSRRLVRRDEVTSNHPGNYGDDMLSSHGGMRRTPPRHGPAMRGQEAPRRYKPYFEHDQREPHGYRGHRHRGYETQNFSAQQGYSSSSKRFAGQRAREEDSYGGRQIPAQEVQSGGYRQYREPPGGAQFPAAQPYHQYARDAGEVDGNKQAGREHRPYQHRRNGRQEKKPQAQARGPVGRRRQYYEDAYTNS